MFKEGRYYTTKGGKQAFVGATDVFPDGNVMVGHIGVGDIATKIVHWSRGGYAVWTNIYGQALSDLDLTPHL